MFTAALGFVLHFFPIGRGLVHASYDALQVARGERKADEAVIIYLDEKSHQELKQPLNAPWDRALHARLVDLLTAAGAKCIVFDVVFSDPALNNPAADETLAKAFKASGRVIIAADLVPLSGGDAQVIPPIDLLRSNAVDIGSAEARPSSDLVVREHTPEEELPSLSWAAAAFVGAPVTTNEAVRAQHRWMNYYGPPGTVKGMSYADSMKGGDALDKFCRGKTVFIGSRILTKFAGERKDEYRNPFGFFRSGGAMFVPGVEIQATAYLNLMRGDWWSRLPDAGERVIIVGLGLVIGFLLVRLPPLRATALVVVALAMLFGVCIFAATRFSWFVAFIAAVQILTSFGITIIYSSLQAYVQKRLAEQTLALYLSPKLVKKFASDPALLKPGARKQAVTLFFSDIADFTKMSEGMDSDRLAHLMNDYFEVAVAQCIHKTDGTVVKYIGDAIFAFWNAPEPQADHALRACEAVLHFRDTGVREVSGVKLHTRIGLHTGVANVGNFGSVERVDYTALGESVNLASRLEGLNKYLGTSHLMSGETLRGGGDKLVTRALGRFRLKGFETAVEVHELIGWPQEAEATRAWREVFANGLKQFQSGDFAAAAMGFQKTLELKPDDGPSKFFLERVSEFIAAGAPAGWGGEIQLKEK